MKIAVCLSGQIRTLEDTIRSHLGFFSWDCDFYLSSPDEIPEEFLKRYKPKSVFVGKVDKDFIGFKKRLIEKYDHPDIFMPEKLFYLKKCFDLVDKSQDYDLVAKARFDSYFFGILPRRDYVGRKIFIPMSGGLSGGYNPHFALGTYGSMKTYCALYDNLEETLEYNIFRYEHDYILREYLSRRKIGVVVADFRHKLLRPKSKVKRSFVKIEEFSDKWNKQKFDLRVEEIERAKDAKISV